MDIYKIALLSPKIATKTTLDKNIDDDLVNYLLSLSDDDDSSDNQDKECVCGRDQVISDSDDSDIVIKRKKPRVIDDSGEDDVFSDDNVHSDDADSTQSLEFSIVDENSDNYCPSNFTYSEIPGPKHVPPPNVDPIDYFNFFFTGSLWNIFVLETNRYAEQFLASQDTLSPRSRVRQWRAVTVIEMKAFIAILLEIGITKRPTIFFIQGR
ncbi:hypothetical protein J437_LFUL010768 [Ladona fulva]|uniref:PiggyBac transposable element-derived protein domain-containing protein n=1 Tax=Ladona fulva TaxID=123851 RepID=A0A8K0P228_LADFU|nr:hypothetical protein J437_LFUL010768 [Ladona fulva]